MREKNNRRKAARSCHGGEKRHVSEGHVETVTAAAWHVFESQAQVEEADERPTPKVRDENQNAWRRRRQVRRRSMRFGGLDDMRNKDKNKKAIRIETER